MNYIGQISYFFISSPHDANLFCSVLPLSVTIHILINIQDDLGERRCAPGILALLTALYCLYVYTGECGETSSARDTELESADAILIHPPSDPKRVIADATTRGVVCKSVSRGTET